uniref:Uncharacterized protein n=1 Tax=Micrurus carvalhoi TaxID=3147026 RepID=A0A2H6N0E2_9SAUR
MCFSCYKFNELGYKKHFFKKLVCLEKQSMKKSKPCIAQLLFWLSVLLVILIQSGKEKDLACRSTISLYWHRVSRNDRTVLPTQAGFFSLSIANKLSFNCCCCFCFLFFISR